MIETNVSAVETLNGAGVDLGLLRTCLVGEMLAETTAKGDGTTVFLAFRDDIAFVDVSAKDVVKASNVPFVGWVVEIDLGARRVLVAVRIVPIRGAVTGAIGRTDKAQGIDACVLRHGHEGVGRSKSLKNLIWMNNMCSGRRLFQKLKGAPGDVEVGRDGRRRGDGFSKDHR